MCKAAKSPAIGEGNISLAKEVLGEDGLPVMSEEGTRGEGDSGVVTGDRCKACFLDSNGNMSAWQNAHNCTRVGGENYYALTTNSFLACKYGGIIKIKSSGQETVMSESDYVEPPQLEEFLNNMQEQFGLDERTASLMGDVYTALKEKNPNTSQKEIDWMFTRLIGGLYYDDSSGYSEFQWNSTAGNTLGKYEEQDFFLNVLGFSLGDYQYLRYKIRVQNIISGYDEKLIAKSIENLGAFKSNYEQGYGLELTDEEFKELWNQQMDELYGYGDLAHQLITTSAILATNLDKNGIIANLVTGSDEKRENFSGWLGDATLGKNPSFGPDDYIADLDAENITYLMGQKNMSLLEASNQYYTEVGKEYTRAEKFLEHTSLDSVKQEITTKLGLYSKGLGKYWVYDASQYPDTHRILTENKAMQLLKEKAPDTFAFIKNLEANNNIMESVK